MIYGTCRGRSWSKSAKIYVSEMFSDSYCEKERRGERKKGKRREKEGGREREKRGEKKEDVILITTNHFALGIQEGLCYTYISAITMWLMVRFTQSEDTNR